MKTTKIIVPRGILYLLVVIIAALSFGGCAPTSQVEVVTPTSGQVEAPANTLPASTEQLPTEALPTDIPSTSETTSDFTLVWAYERGPSEMDPHDPRGTPDNEIVSYLTHNSLLRLTTDNPSLVEPDIAESWDISPDGKTYTFHLRKDVYFWDDWGNMTAEDVAFSIERVLTNTELTANSKVAGFIESVSVIDPYTVEIKLLNAYPAFLTAIGANYSSAVISKKAYESLGKDGFRLYPVGTGPYKIVEWNPGESATLEANENYFGGVPEIKRVQIIAQPDESAASLALQTGEVNFLVVRGGSMWQALKDVDGITINRDPDISTNTLLFFWNTSRPPLDDVRVRQALAYALDRQAMADTIGAGLSGGVADTIIPKSVFGHAEDLKHYEYDPEKAKALLEEAGYPNGFDLVAVTHRSGVYVPTLEATQAFWAQIGVNLQIDVVERLARNERLSAGDFDVNVQDVGRIEPSEWMEYVYSGKIPPDGRAYSRYNNPELDRIIEELNAETDPDLRKQLIVDAQELMAEELPMMPLYYLVNVTAYSDFLKGDLPNLYTWNTRFNEFHIEH